jgi:hypothetical protein
VRPPAREKNLEHALDEQREHHERHHRLHEPTLRFDAAPQSGTLPPRASVREGHGGKANGLCPSPTNAVRERAEGSQVTELLTNAYPDIPWISVVQSPVRIR